MSRINKIENSCCKENEEKVTTKKPPTKRFTTTTSRAILDNGIEESMTKCKLYYFLHSGLNSAKSMNVAQTI